MSGPEHRFSRPFAFAVVVTSLIAWAWLGWGSSASAQTWFPQTTPNASGAEHSALYDVSCMPSAFEGCAAVGKQTAPGGKSSPYAQYWSGSWANEALVGPEGNAAELQSVDCDKEGTCMAAGSYTTSGGVTASLVEYWLGPGWSWKVLATPNPEGATETAFKGVSCGTSLGSCAAVGYSVKSGKKQALVERGGLVGGWTIQTMPVPAGAVSSELHGVDCTSSTFCMAVGSYTLVSGGPQWAMSATWNGTSWTLKTVPSPVEAKASILLDVSCTSAANCTGVGGYRNSGNVQVSFVERWNGSAWSHQGSPNPTGSTNTVFQGVHCPGPTATGVALCVAVGDWNNGKVWQPMAQELVGSAWSLDSVVTPEGATFSLLEGVSCYTRCQGVGWYTDSGGKNKTLGQQRF
jgi:hypothetical protein